VGRERPHVPVGRHRHVSAKEGPAEDQPGGAGEDTDPIGQENIGQGGGPATVFDEVDALAGERAEGGVAAEDADDQEETGRRGMP